MTSATLVAAIAATTLLTATQASGHASLEHGTTAADTLYKAVLRVPHGCDGAPTHTVSVTLPDGVIAAKPMPKAGWSLAVETGPYDRTYDYYGRPMSEGVRRIVWSGGNLPDAFYDEFVFRARITGEAAGKVLAFPTVQDCAGGRGTWDQIATRGQDPNYLEHPAPTLTVEAAAGQGHGQGHGSGHGTAATDGPVSVEAAFARASAGPARNGVAYMTIRNAGDRPDRLLAVRTDVSKKAELHTHLNEGGVMKMRPVEAIEVPAGGMAMLKPGGDHVMLMGLSAPLKEGDSFPLILEFEHAGAITVTVTVGPVGAMGGHGSHKHN